MPELKAALGTQADATLFLGANSVPAKRISRTNRAKCGNWRVPDGMPYELLVLPERDDIDPTVLRKVAELVEAGATVVGPKPTKATGLHQHVARDQAVRALAPIKANAGCCPGSNAAPPAPGRSGLHPGRGRAARPNPPGVQR